ncbi:Uncharacterised protein [Yersinia similis]|uniref:Uncharacterized protein n=1 Tax=Yersinia similis TaxID=367190 RepID=A0A0T9RRP0_9GAMM|nr:Uncharacterised protein [Yersinia similis]CNI79903.1 Uncharacterised protein [Yersinia similis]
MLWAVAIAGYLIQRILRFQQPAKNILRQQRDTAIRRNNLIDLLLSIITVAPLCAVGQNVPHPFTLFAVTVFLSSPLWINLIAQLPVLPIPESPALVIRLGTLRDLPKAIVIVTVSLPRGRNDLLDLTKCITPEFSRAP